MKKLKACWNYEMRKVVLDFSKRQVTGCNVCSSLNISRIIWRRQNKIGPPKMTPYIIYFIAKFTNLSCTPYYLLHRLFIIDFDLPLWEPKVPCLNPRNDISWFVFYISWFMFISLFHIIKRKLIFARFLSIRHNHFWPRTRMDLSLDFLSLWTKTGSMKAKIGTGKTG